MDERQKELLKEARLRQRGAAIIEGNQDALRLDSYTNLLNKYGTAQDNSTAYAYQAETFADDLELIRLYEGNGLFAKIIDRPSEEAVKHGLDIDYGDVIAAEYAEDRLDELDFEDKFATAEKWARLYGGSIIVMLVDDGRGLEEPLDWKEARSIQELRVFERSIVQPDYASLYQFHFADSIEAGKPFGEPERYSVFSVYGYFTVHRTRCLVFRNGRLPEQTTDANYRYWGIPEYVKIRRALRECVTAHEDGVKLMERSVQAIYRMKNLSQLLATDRGEDDVLKRLQVIDMARGILNSIAIDDGEDYRFENFSTTGVKDIIDSTCNMLSAVTNIPQTVLFGRSPAGQNSTGKSDLENYYNMVENIQKQNMKANARTVIDLILRQGVYEGRLKEVPRYKVKFSALWSMSDTEQAEVAQKRAQVEQTKAQTIAAYLEQGVLDPEEVRRTLAKEGDIEVEEIISEKDLAPEDGAQNLPDNILPSEVAASAKVADNSSSQNDSSAVAAPEYDAAAVVVFRDGKVLCAARRDQQGLCGPGGRLKPGESPEEAAFREAQEEFNIVPLSPIPFGELQASQGRYLRTKLYFADRFTGTPEADGMELIDERWVRIDELHKEPLFPAFEESLELFREALRPFAKRHEDQADGSSGSGNWGHIGRPGKVGGSGKGGGVHNRTGTKESGYSSAAKERAKEKAAKSAGQLSSKSGGGRPIVEGKNIVASYTGSGDIKSVIHAQGFDGLPKCVGRKEFDKAVEASGFIAQRTYSATSQEVLDAYHDQLCNGEWYVECTEGGAFYGQGMYCAADYTGKLSEGVQSEIALYTQIGRNSGNPYAKIETLTLDPSAKIISYKDVLKAHNGELTDERANQFVRDYAEPKLKSIGEKYGEQAETAARWKFGDSDISWEAAGEAAKSVGEEVTAKIVEEVNGIQSGAYGALNAYRNQVRKEAEETRKQYGDVGAYAAALGYDAINADVFGVSHTVILNRTKVIILDEGVRKDGKDGTIRFHLGKDGVIYAFKDRKVIGCVFVHSAPDNRMDGDSGSGNWGHKGVPGQLGGSAPGGGIAHRTGSKASGYSSAAKERAKAKAQSSAKGQTEENYASGNVKLAHTSYKVGEFSQSQQTLIESTFENLKKTYPISDADLPIVQGVREKYGLPYDCEDWEVEDKLYEMGIRDPYAISADGHYTLKDGRMELTLGAGLFTGSGTGDSMQDSFEYIHQKGLKQTGDTDQAGFGPEYVLTHEYGHVLAHSVGIYGSQKNVQPLAEYYRENKAKIRSEISGYATQNWNEMFAEAFAQSFSPYQSEASKEIMSIYERAADKEKKADSGLGVKGGNNHDNFANSLDISGKSGSIKLENPRDDGGPGSGNFGHKGVPGQVGGSAPASSASNSAGASSSSGSSTASSAGNSSQSAGASSGGQSVDVKAEIAKRGINTSKMKRDQYKHYKNSSAYVQGKSYLTVDETELKSIVKQNIGKGLPLVDKNGNWRQIENIDCGKVVGYNLDLSGNETPTQFGDIHYSKDGWHFVPTYDRRKP